MKRKICIWMAAAVTALALTACGDGSGVVINGTTAAQGEENAGGAPEETPASGEGETTAQAGGTKINIITGETVADSTQSPPEETQPETTAAPTTAAPTTAAAPVTTAAPETTAAREYAVRDVSKTMYAKSSVRVRAGYSTSTDILGALAEGESVQVTGESDNGWMRVTWKGQTGFVSKSYLSDDPPATKAPTTESRPTATQNGGTTPGTTGTTTTPGGNGQAPSPGNQTPAPGTDTQQNAGGASSISGTVLQCDPTGVTIQASNGASYTFSWGSAAIPADLQPGNSVQITYQGSTVVTISK